MNDKIRVIIADDNKEYAETLRKELTADEQIVVAGVAFDGKEAVRVLAVTEADVLLLDMVMPVWDGFFVLKELDRMELKIRPVVIVVSSALSDKGVASTIGAGADYFMFKSAEFDVLKNSIWTVGSHHESAAVKSADTLTLNNDTPNRKQELEYLVTDILHEIRMHAHIKGYQYLRYAITLAVEDMTILDSMTKQLYPAIAEAFHTTVSRAQRNIRDAIVVVWDRGDLEALNLISGYTISKRQKRPSNSEFIFMIVDRLRLQINRRRTV